MFSEFTQEDQVIARSLLKRLPPKQKKAIVLRFWHNYSIFEIAKSLRLTWGETDSLIKDALLKMKKDCMKQPRFSRAVKLIIAA
jgi:DNA-directed RNA polymerase specialized sigma24 family protein